MKREIRLAKKSEIAEIIKVIKAAREIMRSSGNSNQWINGYPSEAVILSDIKSCGGFVMLEDEEIIAYFAFLPAPEPTYSKIYDGNWLDEKMSYHVVHRIASYREKHNVFRDIMDFCFTKDKNIRIDTHRDNEIMKKCITKYGFSYCGIILLENDDERLAYQKIVGI